MTKPSILIITTKLPWPLHGGDRIRIFEQAKALYESGWNVDLYASVQVDSDNDAALVELKETRVFRSIELLLQSNVVMKCRAIRSLWTKLPAQVEYFYNPKIANVVALKSNQYDVILFHHIRSVKPWLKGAAVPRHAVLDLHDSIARNYEMAAKLKFFPINKAYEREACMLDRAEEVAIKKFSKVIIISDIDCSRLSGNHSIENRIVRVPISVRKAAFQYQSKYNSNGPILFFGRLAYAPNRDAVEYLIQEIMPKVWEKNPNRMCCVTGSEPSSVTQKLCASDKRIQLLADVTDIYSIIENASIVVVPIRYGAGMQNKVLESMAIGMPIVGTSFAFEGIGGIPQKHYYVGKNADEIASNICHLLNNPCEMKIVGENAREHVRESFFQERWNRIFVSEIESMRSGKPI